jgi:hypothetical protein
MTLDARELPIGGTTGLCHATSSAIDDCALWLAATAPDARPRPLYPAMRAMFGLTASEFTEAIRESKERGSAPR